MNLYKMCTRGGNPLSSPPGSDVHRLYFPLSSSLDDDESMRRLTAVLPATVPTVAAETAADYSKKHPKTKMTPVTDFAAALDCVAIDPLVVLPEER
eukprot:scaffold6855_cov216-Skeletonema_dohrnii-CCMP3373.AAC.3